MPDNEPRLVVLTQGNLWIAEYVSPAPGTVVKDIANCFEPQEILRPVNYGGAVSLPNVAFHRKKVLFLYIMKENDY